MREILFRAKRVDNKEWSYGYYANCCFPGRDKHLTGHFIIEYPNKYHEIYTETVCQYTGLKDKDENKIFEYDIVRNSRGMIGKVVYIESFCGFCIADDNGLNSLDDTCVDIEVIGNIFDNPELSRW